MSEEATPTVATEATNPPKTRGRTAAVLSLVNVATGEVLKAIKYPMPIKAPRFALSVDGVEVSAANTTFGTIKYTYFEHKGASFYVPGHIDQEAEYTFQAPEGYVFTPLKLDRKATADAAAAAKKAKAPQKADAAPVQADAAPLFEGEGVGSPEPVEAAAAPAASGKKGKKASR